MREKIKEKHGAEKSKTGLPQPEFSAVSSSTAGVRPPDQSWWTGAQFAALVPGFDDPKLRRLARDTNPATGAPWIPSPRSSKFEFTPTLKGVIAYLLHQLSTRNELPGSYDSAQAMANVFSAEKKAIIWLTRNGAEGSQLGGSRIAPLPVLRRALEIIGQIADGRVTGIDSLEAINTNNELGLKIREERKKLEDEALLRRGAMMISKDGTFALLEMVVDELIWDMRDQPLRAALCRLDKTINRQHKNIIGDKEKTAKCAAVTTAAVQEMLGKLRARIPPEKSRGAGELEKPE